MPSTDDDLLRAAAFAHLRTLIARHGEILSYRVLAEPFQAGDTTLQLMNRARGIWKPKAMTNALSLKTTMPRHGRAKRYADQHDAHRAFEGGDAPFHYAFQGTDPHAHDNRALERAFKERLPLIWFLGVAESLYRPVAPVFVVAFEPERTRVALTPGSAALSAPEIQAPPASPDERRYSLKTLKQRLHQSLFRQRVVKAYGHRCAFSGLPVEGLIDAAHILEDGDAELGQPVVANGISASKLHHAAFDANLIGIDPDFRVHVAPVLTETDDGPMLEALKTLAGRPLVHLPRDPALHPDPRRLEVRFVRFLEAAR